jgi:hypothetical protein
VDCCHRFAISIMAISYKILVSKILTENHHYKAMAAVSNLKVMLSAMCLKFARLLKKNPRISYLKGKLFLQ